MAEAQLFWTKYWRYWALKATILRVYMLSHILYGMFQQTRCL